MRRLSSFARARLPARGVFRSPHHPSEPSCGVSACFKTDATASADIAIHHILQTASTLPLTPTATTCSLTLRTALATTGAHERRHRVLPKKEGLRTQVTTTTPDGSFLSQGSPSAYTCCGLRNRLLNTVLARSRGRATASLCLLSSDFSFLFLSTIHLPTLLFFFIACAVTLVSFLFHLPLPNLPTYLLQHHPSLVLPLLFLPPPPFALYTVAIEWPRWSVVGAQLRITVKYIRVSCRLVALVCSGEGRRAKTVRDGGLEEAPHLDTGTTISATHSM